MFERLDAHDCWTNLSNEMNAFSQLVNIAGLIMLESYISTKLTHFHWIFFTVFPFSLSARWTHLFSSNSIIAYLMIFPQKNTFLRDVKKIVINSEMVSFVSSSSGYSSRVCLCVFSFYKFCVCGFIFVSFEVDIFIIKKSRTVRCPNDIFEM